MPEKHDVRSMMLAGVLILCGLILLARNLSIPLAPWLGPVLLITLGLLGFLFPMGWAQWRAERTARRTRRYDLLNREEED